MRRPLICWCCAFLFVAAVNVPVDAADCKRVEGFLEETLATEDCLSAVGLCTVAQLFGHLKGESHFTATAFIPSADTPTTSVVFVTGDNTIVDARFEDRQGTIIVKDAAAFNTTNGELVDNQTIIGGTDGFAGASGSLRISGSFLLGTGTGTSRFEGTLCLP